MTQPFALALLVSVGSLQVATPPSDFAIQLAFGVCTFEEINTAEHLYTRVSPAGRQSAKVKLSRSERQKLFDHVMAAKFLDMPTELPPQAVDGMITVTSPSAFYRLQVQVGGKVHTVSFRDDSGSMTEEAQRFRQLVQDIASVYRNRREVRGLPRPKFEIYCA